MKIAHVIDYFQPQFGYQETYLARQQLAEGHDVCVFTSERFRPIFYNGGGAQNVLGERIQRSGNFVEEGIRVCRLDVAV